MSEEKREPQPSAAQFADRATVWALPIRGALAKRRLRIRLNRAYTHLGKAVYTKHGEQSGPTELVTPIANAQTRLAVLASEIRQLSESPPGQVLTPRRIAVCEVGGLAILLVVVVAILANGCSDKLSTKEGNAARAVLKELKKLGSYTEAGLNYSEYQKRVLDAKGEIDSQLLDIPAGPLKDALKNSLDAYVDAKDYWEDANQEFEGDSSYHVEKKFPRFAKYLVFREGVRSVANTNKLPLFWRYGSEQATVAEHLISR